MTICKQVRCGLTRKVQYELELNLTKDYGDNDRKALDQPEDGIELLNHWSVTHGNFTSRNGRRRYSLNMKQIQEMVIEIMVGNLWTNQMAEPLDQSETRIID
jgi:hypothetical protein